MLDLWGKAHTAQLLTVVLTTMSCYWTYLCSIMFMEHCTYKSHWQRGTNSVTYWAQFAGYVALLNRQYSAASVQTCNIFHAYLIASLGLGMDQWFSTLKKLKNVFIFLFRMRLGYYVLYNSSKLPSQKLDWVQAQKVPVLLTSSSVEWWNKTNGNHSPPNHSDPNKWHVFSAVELEWNGLSSIK